MAEVGTAFVSILPSAKGFGKKLQGQVEPDTKKTGMSLGKKLAAGFAVAGGAGAAFGFLKGAVSDASDLSESASKVGVVFGKQAGQIMSASKTSATAMGLSKSAYLEANGTLGNLLVSLDIGPKKAAGLSQQMVKLAGDMASFSNTTPEEALDALKSGLTGETEPLKRFGVNMNDATLKAQALKMGLIKNTKEALTPQTKALAAQKLIMNQTKTAQGDFARTSGGLANQQRILSAQTSDLKAKIGTALLPVITSGTTKLNKFVGEMQKGTGAGGRFKEKLSDVGSAAKASGGFLNDHRSAVATVAGVYVGYRAALVGVAIAHRIAAAATAVSTFATNAHTLATAINQSLLFTWVGVKALEAAAWIRSTAGAVASTIAMAANRAAYAALNLTAFIAQKGVEAAAWIRSTAAMVASKIATVAAAAATKAYAAGQWLLNAALNANPIGIVVIAIAALAAGLVYAYKHSETFRNIVNGAFHAVVAAGKFMWHALVGYFKILANVWLTVAGVIIHGAAKAFGWIPGIGGKIKGLAAGFDRFKSNVNRAFDKINGQHAVNEVNNLRRALDGLKDKQVTVTTMFVNKGKPAGGGAAGLPGQARGTNDFAGGLTWVGERGPEIVNLPRHSQVIPNHKLGHAANGIGGDGVMRVVVMNPGDIAMATDGRADMRVAAHAGVSREAARARR